MRGLAGVGQAPPLWAWLAIGFGVDGIGLAGLFQLAARLPHDAVFLNLLSPIFSLLFVAWMSHVIVVPALLRAPGPRRTTELLEALLFGSLYIPVALVGVYIVSAYTGGSIVLIVSWFVAAVLPQTWISKLDFTPMVYAAIYTGSAAGGAVAGAMTHIWRTAVRGHPKSVWRRRSDVIGGALAVGLFTVGSSIVNALYPPGPAGAWRPRFVVEVIFPLVGTLALMPHLVMLGLDLRCAANQSHQPTPNSKSP